MKTKHVDPMPQREKKKVQFIPTRHNCGIIGHIRLHCHKLNRVLYSHGSFALVCHHCGVKGHIRPHCFNLNSTHKKVNKNSKKKNKVRYVEKIVKPKTKFVWVRKSELNCHVVHTAYKAHNTHMWYLDSGCSRHMSGD